MTKPLHPSAPPELVDALAIPGINQRRLARALGVHAVTISRWKTGDVECPRYARHLLAFVAQTPPARWPSCVKEAAGVGQW